MLSCNSKFQNPIRGFLGAEKTIEIDGGELSEHSDKLQ